MLYTVLIFVIIVLILEKMIEKKDNPPTLSKNLEEINYKNKYVKKDYLLTQTELKFYKILKQITDEMNLTICTQVALYEIIKNIEYKDFNKIKSKTIDFVITEPNLKIKFCIELDDYTHNKKNRIERDTFVNKLFEDLNIKLIRIPVKNFYNIDELKNKINEF